MSTSRCVRIFLIAFFVAMTFGCGSEAPPPAAASVSGGAKAEPLAALLPGMGDHEFPITTDNPEAQKFFNQALVMAYGFNHPGAERAFKEAARLDPKCAACWWGVAYVLGPNINARMEPGNNGPAWDALQEAVMLAPGASAREQAFIEALSARYAEIPPEDRTSLDEAYADAMRELRMQLTDDDDAATLFAEALMDLHPWDYWEKDGTAKPWTAEILQALEWVIAANERHPGANHYYIHAVEASPDPGRGMAAADMLRDLVPGVGHLVHMPGHIYIRTGRYHDASLANEAAIGADNQYVVKCHGSGDTAYELTYIPHNWHFLWASATMEGRSVRALEAAGQMSAAIDQQIMRQPGMGTLQHYWVTPLYANVRFGKWEEILAYPEPDADLLYPRGVWHYARAMAFASTERLDEAKAELDALQRIAADKALDAITIWDINGSKDLIDIARLVVQGEISRREGNVGDAITRLELAVEGQDNLRYDEPPPFHFQVRHLLGLALLDAGRYEDAERIYEEDLEFYPENGYSLIGLAQALRKQGKRGQAAAITKRFEEAWQWADFEIGSSWL